MEILIVIIPIVTLLGGIGIGYFLRKKLALKQREGAEVDADKIIGEAKTKEKEIILSAKDRALKINEELKKEEQERKNKLLHSENRLEKREEFLDSKLEEIEKNRKDLETRSQNAQRIKQELVSIKRKQLETLEKVAGLSKEKAKEVLLEMVEKDMQEQVLARIEKVKRATKEKADVEAKNIIAQAIQRQSQSQASETTTTTVGLPSDEMKGRIIGREGRNIKKLEELTGVEIVVDDTPEAIVISGFNPIRRHVAKMTLEKLIVDGRIHPARIEEKVEESKKEIAKSIKEAGENTVYDLGIADFDPKLVQLLGRLKYRTSYGQNVLQHSVEVANLSKILAEELGANVTVAKKAGIMHDIGKAVDHEVEGTHIEIGRNILKKFKESEEIIHAMECHHDDVEPRTIEAVIVDAADSISGARPGARKDTYENYIKRLEELENIATSFGGVEKSYAIQAGREVRVFVMPKEIDDLAATKLAKNIADKIESELKYPGEIKVNVIRETRAIEYAR
jgi:ribonuclease Y